MIAENPFYENIPNKQSHRDPRSSFLQVQRSLKKRWLPPVKLRNLQVTSRSNVQLPYFLAPYSYWDSDEEMVPTIGDDLIARVGIKVRLPSALTTRTIMWTFMVEAVISMLDLKPRLMIAPLLPSTLGCYHRLMVFIFQHWQSPSNQSWNRRGVEAFQVRFVPSFVVITLWSSLPQLHIHCFSNKTDFAARLFAHFPNFTSNHRYETHSFLWKARLICSEISVADWWPHIC